MAYQRLWAGGAGGRPASPHVGPGSSARDAWLPESTSHSKSEDRLCTQITNFLWPGTLTVSVIHLPGPASLVASRVF